MKTIFLLSFLIFLSITANGQKKMVCSKSEIPKGWVIEHQNTCINCCGGKASNDVRWRYYIVDISKRKIGSTQAVCSLFNVPRGWKIYHKRQCICCGASSDNWKTTWIIERVE